MMRNENIYGSKFDKDILKDLKDIDSKLKEEEGKEEPDREEILKLKMLKLYRGMELNNGYITNYPNRGIPY